MARTPSSSRRRAVIGAAGCALATAALWAAAAPAAVNYPDFDSTAGLKLNGSASESSNALRLTGAINDQTGSAFTKKAVVKPNRNFKTQFQISQHDTSSSPGDGMAFVIQKKGSSALGDGGGGLGYGGITHSLIVEFDIFQNVPTDPGNGNHIALMKDGDAATHIDASDPGFSLYQNAPYVWVNYNAKAKKIKAWVSTTDTKPDVPNLDHKINLNQILVGSNGYAGFTGATGGSNANQDVLSWKLKSG